MTFPTFLGELLSKATRNCNTDAMAAAQRKCAAQCNEEKVLRVWSGLVWYDLTSRRMGGLVSCVTVCYGMHGRLGMHVCMHGWMDGRMDVCMVMYECRYVCMYDYLRMFLIVCVCLRNVCMHIHAYIHCIHTYYTDVW